MTKHFKNDTILGKDLYYLIGNKIQYEDNFVAELEAQLDELNPDLTLELECIDQEYDDPWINISSDQTNVILDETNVFLYDSINKKIADVHINTFNSFFRVSDLLQSLKDKGEWINQSPDNAKEFLDDALAFIHNPENINDEYNDVVTVLVCGGRDFTDKEYLFLKLDEFVKTLKGKDVIVIHGNAKGADSLAAEWALERMQAIVSYPADWDSYGKAAGAIRNQKMLDEGQPDVVIAFAGGKGTADMIERTKKAKIPYITFDQRGFDFDDLN